jgi:cell division protein FtsB
MHAVRVVVINVIKKLKAENERLKKENKEVERELNS